MKIKWVFLFCLFTSLGISQKATPPKIVQLLPLGDSYILDNSTLKFEAVLEDSRCPKGVSCIWAGRVRVRLIETSNTGQRRTIIATIGALKAGEQANKVLATTNNQTLEVVDVSPYPIAGQTLEGAYTLMLYNRIN